ncbi:hypothetical protein GCM10022281_14560 [Sphingomonas rosea]|uniref:Methyltransferase type 11 domain-containing protein n=1 Tax=Sphingomonas rosea TaxID=335605 RepID=A0ABP7U3N8_9SPHN
MNLLRTAKKRLVRGLRPASLPQTRSTRPTSDSYGFDRGRPIDRYYIDRFFAAHAADMRGDVLEVQEWLYGKGAAGEVTGRHVLDIDPANPDATVVADLSAADDVPAESFDCILLPQTLQFIFEAGAAIRHCHRMLRPGGVLLATVPGTARVDPELYASDYWRFTPASCERLLAGPFGGGASVTSFGNALACGGFIAGLSVEEFSASELDPVDSFFPLILGLRARKA